MFNVIFMPCYKINYQQVVVTKDIITRLLAGICYCQWMCISDMCRRRYNSHESIGFSEPPSSQHSLSLSDDDNCFSNTWLTWFVLYSQIIIHLSIFLACNYLFFLVDRQTTYSLVLKWEVGNRVKHKELPEEKKSRSNPVKLAKKWSVYLCDVWRQRPAPILG